MPVADKADHMHAVMIAFLGLLKSRREEDMFDHCRNLSGHKRKAALVIHADLVVDLDLESLHCVPGRRNLTTTR